jgi:hypothetical protein
MAPASQVTFRAPGEAPNKALKYVAERPSHPDVQRRVLGFCSVFIAALALVGAGGTAASAEPPTLGLMVDAGLPDGAQGAVVYHPVGFVRLHAGGGYNLVSPGVRAGVSIMRARGGMRPSLVLEAGRYFDGDANPLMRQLIGEPEYHEDSLSKVGYDWVSAHVGLELGTDHIRFFLHAGFSEIRSRVHDPDALVGESSQAHFEQDLRISGHVPSGRLGFIFYVH